MTSSHTGPRFRRLTEVFSPSPAHRDGRAQTAYLAQLLVPFLHTAWMRTQMNGRTEVMTPPTHGTNTIKPREQNSEVDYLGKSNFEMGPSSNQSALKKSCAENLAQIERVNRAQRRQGSGVAHSEYLKPCMGGT